MTPESAEENLVHWMRVNRADGQEQNRVQLLEAGRAFHSIYSKRATDYGKSYANTLITKAWDEMQAGYERGVEGGDLADLAFEVYRVLVTHRI